MRSRFDPWLVVALLLLGAFAVLGIGNGIRDLQSAESRLQVITSVAQTGYGFLALVAIPGLLTGWRGLKAVLQLWMVALAVTGGLAPVAWGEASPGVGVAAFLLTLAIALAVIWVVRRAQVAP
jgi:hypothetical protein